MHAVTNRPWTLWLAAVVVVGTIGCRGSRPFGSIVKVTQEDEAELANIDAPKQRLAIARPRSAASDPAAQQLAPSAADVSNSTTDPTPQSSRRESTAAKRSLSAVQAASNQATVGKTSRQNTAATNTGSQQAGNLALPNSEIAEIKLPAGNTEELMLAFKDYPPEVQREALRRLIATTSRTAERSSQPESVTTELTERLADLPELPNASAGDPNAPPPKRIARDRPSSSSVVSAATPVGPAKSTNNDRSQSRVTEIETSELQPAVAQISDSKETQKTSEVKTAVVSEQSDQSSVTQASVEKDLEGSPTEVSMTELQAEPDEPPPLMSSGELFSQLLQQLSTAPEGESEADRASRLIKLRHVMVLSGDPDGAVEQVDGMAESEQEYLRHQLLGLWTMIDPQGHPVPSRRFSTAVSQIREAAKFAAAATDSLEVRSLEFCTEIESYGQVKPFKTRRFDAGQQVILYCEIENFTAEKTDEGFETHLQGSYDLFNEKDEKVVSQLLPADQQVSANYLRDYFIAYQMHLPEQVPAGKYRLQLTMEDVNGKKYGQASISLEIKK
jgi:hypothetical protein